MVNLLSNIVLEIAVADLCSSIDKIKEVALGSVIKEPRIGNGDQTFRVVISK